MEKETWEQTEEILQNLIEEKLQLENIPVESYVLVVPILSPALSQELASSNRTLSTKPKSSAFIVITFATGH